MYEEEVSTKSQKGTLLLAYILYLMLGAVIFQALEKDFEAQQRQLAVKTKVAFLKNRSNMTQEDVELFVLVREEEDTVIFRRRPMQRSQ